MKIKIQIKSWLNGEILFEYESENNTIKETLLEAIEKKADLRSANLSSADLRSADLRSADLRSANLSFKNLPIDWLNQCSRDILFIFTCLRKEVPFLKDKLLKGEINGSQYEGDCACLIGTLANGDGGLEKVCQMIPYYDKGTHNFGEQFFLKIDKGDTPENSEWAKHVMTLIEWIEAKDVKPKKKSKKQ